MKFTGATEHRLRWSTDVYGHLVVGRITTEMLLLGFRDVGGQNMRFDHQYY
jgi:hypothetical protein